MLPGDRKSYRLAVLPGDGVGSEIVAEAEKVLHTVGERFGHTFVMDHALVGGVAMDATGEPLPEAARKSVA